MKQRKIPVLGTWLNYKKKTVTEGSRLFSKSLLMQELVNILLTDPLTNLSIL